jgi:resorcinol 4-hydroxylase (FADH2)
VTASAVAAPHGPRPGPADDVMTQARELAQGLFARASATEAERTLAAETVRELDDAGFFRLLQPARFGGLELGFGALSDVARELAKGCGSCAWVVVVLNSAWLVAGFEKQAQEEVWEGGRAAVIGNVLAPSIDVERVEGGYRLGGRWRFASGVDHSDWQILSGLLIPDGAAPEVRLFLVPRRDYVIVDDWHTVGLRGTGSKTILAEDVFVPNHRTAALADFRAGTQPGGAVHANALYRMPIGVVFPPSLASVAVGVAQGAYGRWRDWMAGRVTRGVERTAEQVPVQIRLAEAAVEIDAAELLLRRDLTAAERTAANGGEFTPWDRARSRRDGAYAMALCVRAADQMLAASGGSGLYDHHPIHRAWRDLHAAAAHVAFMWDDAAANFGRVEFGLGFTNRFFD